VPQRHEVLERHVETALQARLGVEVVVRDERAEVVGAQGDEDGVDELPGPSSPVGWLVRISP